MVRPGKRSGSMRLTAHLGGNTAEITWNVLPVSAASGLVREISPSVLDLPLGTMLENEQAKVVLSEYLGPLLENPTLGQMRTMPLKKILSMGGGVPEGLEDALSFLQSQV